MGELCLFSYEAELSASLRSTSWLGNLHCQISVYDLFNILILSENQLHSPRNLCRVAILGGLRLQLADTKLLFDGEGNHRFTPTDTPGRHSPIPQQTLALRAFGWWMERADEKGVKETARHKPLKMLSYVGEYT